MSRKSFVQLFRNETFRNWYKYRDVNAAGKGLKGSILAVGRDDPAVKAGLASSMGDAVIPLSQLAEYFNDPLIASAYSNTAASQGVKAKAIYDLAQSGAFVSQGIEARQAIDKETGQIQQQIFMKDIPYVNAAKYVDAKLDLAISILNKQNTNEPQVEKKQSFYEFVKSKKLQTGHVYGFANSLSRNTVKEVVDFFEAQFSREEKLVDKGTEKYKEMLATQAIIKKQLESLNQFVDDVDNILLALDTQSSELVGIQEGEMYANYRKSHTTWLWEFQPEKVNLAAGNVVGSAIGRQKYAKITEKTSESLRGFFAAAINNPDNADTALRTFVNAFITLGSTPGKFSLMEQESSPSVIEFIEDSLISILSKKPKKLRPVIENNVKLPNIIRGNITKNNSELQKAKQLLKNTKNKIAKTKNVLRSKQADTKRKVIELATKSTTNLPSLLIRINGLLEQQIRKNMGTGSRRDVLNYRSGRFAEGVKVEKLSESRQGMITAFYSYMKNPYATFSQGGRQALPASRDPKLLIAKSIRELAQTMVTNRLRAVNV